MRQKVNLGVLVSGNGSNLQSIIDNIDRGFLHAVIKVVISSNPGAHALERAALHKIPTVVIQNHEYGKKDESDQEMINVLSSYSVELVIMAGFMRILGPLFLRAFPLRIMNIHPALLPSFSGVRAQGRAAEYGVKFTGCTVHFADEGVDTGPVIIQAVVPAYPEDTEDTLAARILMEEHKIYPQAIQFYAEGRIEVTGRKVRIRNADRMPNTGLYNPPLSIF
jgi:phosphoribosylglycinamide formyltransferase-1